jgi:hypothetical protein
MEGYIILLEAEFLVFEGQVAIDQVKVNHALFLVLLLLILIVEQFHILHHKVTGLYRM